MIHLDYPFHFDGRRGAAQTGRDDHVRDMIEQFLFTSAGERVNRPDFGSGLMQLVFAPNSPELAAALKHTVQAGLQRWLGDVIEVRELDVISRDAVLRVELEYAIRRTGEVRAETFVQDTA